MTDREIIDTLLIYNGGDCTNCQYKDCGDCTNRLRTEAAFRLSELSRAVEQKDNVSQETENSQENMSSVQLEPERATEYISIPVAEYQWLTQQEALLLVILSDTTYSHENAVDAVRNAWENSMYRASEGRGEA